jgi:hypothetical protein
MQPTVIIVLNDLDSSGQPLVDGIKYNNAGHEFGHARGLGHSTLGDDLMTGFRLQDGRVCVSSLNLLALDAAYGWLGGPYGPAPARVSELASAYSKPAYQSGSGCGN